LLALLNVPATQSAQLRSDVALGATASCSPKAHTVCLLHVLRPASGWNVFSPQA
jgi:hypothetical protein